MSNLWPEFRYKRYKKRWNQAKINRSLKKKLYKDLLFNPCYYCNRIFLIDQLTIEHIIPISFGGSNDSSNITLACKICNQEKGRESWILKRNLLRNNYVR